MPFDLSCIIKDCEMQADGLVMVNLNGSGLTVFMIPACTEHAQKLKSNAFTIQLRLKEDPIIKIGEEMDADLTLMYDVIEAGIG